MRIAAYARPACIEQERRCGGRAARGQRIAVASGVSPAASARGLSGFAIVEDAQRAAYCRVL